MNDQLIQSRLATRTLPSGVRLHYAEQGDPAGPGVLLLHGFTDSWFSWSAVMPLLSPAFHVVAISQRGFGDSNRPESGYSIDDYATDVLAFMDAAGMTTATVVGHSMGSWIAQRVASLAPSRVERLMLVGSSAGPIAAVEELAALAETLVDPVSEQVIRDFQSSTLAQPVTDAFFEQVVAESGKVPARVWRGVIAGWQTDQRWADPARLRSMPVRIIWGDQDAYFIRAEQDALCAALPHADLIVYQGTGHTPQWEQPERFARDLEAFLSVPASGPMG